MLHDPVHIAITPGKPAVERIEQKVMFVEKADKDPLLASLLADPGVDRVIVFTQMKHMANRVAQKLTRRGVTAAAIHGNKSQAARTRALEGFKRGEVRVLVATDIAARGIDVDGITHVVNYDLCQRAGNLCAPHRSHRPRGQRGGRRLLLQSARARIPARHRAAPAPRGAGGHRARLALREGAARDRRRREAGAQAAARRARRRAAAARVVANAGDVVVVSAAAAAVSAGRTAVAGGGGPNRRRSQGRRSSSR